MHEGVLPADHVPLRPPVLPEGVVGLGHEHGAEALRRAPGVDPARWTCSSLRRSRSNASEPLVPLTSKRERVLAPGGEARGLDRPHGAALEARRRLDGVVDLAPRLEGRGVRGHRVDLADEVAGEVDHVRAEVAERARPGGRLVEAPEVGVGGAPLLQVGAAEVVDLAELAGLDHLARQPHRRHEAVVERAHVLDAGGLHAPPGLVGLGRVAAQRLLADDVLARLGGGDRRLGVEVVRARSCRTARPRSSATSARQSVTCSRTRSGAPPRPRPARCGPRSPPARGRSGGGHVM